MERYYDLEINILSCLLQKPELMKQVKLEDKHFINHKKMWLFMKTFYEKFGTIDLTLMYQIIKNKFKFVEYMEWLADVCPSTTRFNQYQDELIRLYNQKKNEKQAIELIYEMANKLIVGTMKIEDFKNNVNKIYERIIGGEKNEK